MRDRTVLRRPSSTSGRTSTGTKAASAEVSFQGAKQIVADAVGEVHSATSGAQATIAV